MKELDQAEGRRKRAESRIPTNSESLILTTQGDEPKENIEDTPKDGDLEVLLGEEKRGHPLEATQADIEDPGNYAGSERDSEEDDTNSESEEERKQADQLEVKEKEVRLKKGVSKGESKKLYGSLVEKNQITSVVARVAPEKDEGCNL
ncbi:hypothetical protein DFH28DRAFT_928978 [Melampsora americana]|nr:hypothetical protein DFH28DRAFT_928978 [Melampsora americana]